VDSNWAKALISAAIWIGVLVAVRYGLRYVFSRYERRLAEHDPAVGERRSASFFASGSRSSA
jgi:hypothetical protein